MSIGAIIQDEPQLIALLERLAEPFRFVLFKDTNFQKEFGQQLSVITPIGEVELDYTQFEKLFTKGRKAYFGLIKPTLEKPLLVIQNEGGYGKKGEVFIKTFVDKSKKIIYFVSVARDEKGFVRMVSAHEKKLKGILKGIREGKVTHQNDRLLPFNFFENENLKGFLSTALVASKQTTPNYITLEFGFPLRLKYSKNYAGLQGAESIAERIKALEAALEFTDSTQQSTKIKERIKALEAALEFAEEKPAAKKTTKIPSNARQLVYYVEKERVEDFFKNYPKVYSLILKYPPKNGNYKKGYVDFLKKTEADRESTVYGARSETISSPNFGTKTFYHYDKTPNFSWPELYAAIHELGIKKPIEKEKPTSKPTFAPKSRGKKPVAKPSPTRAEKRLEIEYINIADIYTDEENFQQRKQAYSERSVNNIIQAVENGTFNWNELDPVTLWISPKDFRYYVLSGHSRLEAFRRLFADGYQNFELIPARVFEGTLAEAKEIALRSNTLSTKESSVERAGYYHKLFAAQKPRREIVELAKKQESKNWKYIINLAQLNQDGALLSDLEALGEDDTTNNLKKIADYIGEARGLFPQLTDKHEAELYKYLTKNNRIEKYNKNEFLAELNKKMMFFDPAEALNLENFVAKNTIEQSYDEALKEARRALKEANEAREEKRKDLARKLKEQKGSLNNEDTKRIQAILVEGGYDRAVQKAEQELLRLESQRDNIKEQAKKQVSLFGVFGDNTKISKKNTKAMPPKKKVTAKKAAPKKRKDLGNIAQQFDKKPIYQMSFVEFAEFNRQKLLDKYLPIEWGYKSKYRPDGLPKPEYEQELRMVHRAAVKRALARKLEVPAKVLKAYPELTGKPRLRSRIAALKTAQEFTPPGERARIAAKIKELEKQSK